jgi:hypothetical protein
MSIFDAPRPTGRPRDLGPNGRGLDVLPPSTGYRGVRLPPRLLEAPEARARREAGRPFDADHLRDALRALGQPVNWTVGDGDVATELRRRGWAPEPLAAAQVDLREELVRRVRPPSDPALTAGAVRTSRSSETTAPAASPPTGRTGRDLAAMARNVNAARRMGLNPATLWPGQAGLPGRPRPNLLASGDVPSASPSFGPALELRVLARPGRPGTGGGARRVVPVTSANRPASRATGRRAW